MEKTSLIHYLYLLPDKKDCINRILKFFDQENNYSSILKECKKAKKINNKESIYSLYSFEKDNIRGSLYLFEDIFIFRFLMKSKEEELASPDFFCQQYKKWSKKRKELNINSDDLMGESTLLFTPSGRLKEEDFFLQTKELSLSNTTFKTETRYGNLYHFFDLEDEDHHIYALFSRNDLKPGLKKALSPFLEEWLPSLDATLFKLEPKIRIFTEKIRDVMEKKEKIDDKISDILHYHMEVKKGGTGFEAENNEKLDKAMEMVSEMYSTLAAYLQVIKRARSELNTELLFFRDIVERITFSGSSDNAFLTEYQRRYEHKLVDFNSIYEDVKNSLVNIKTGIEVIQAQIELERNRESIFIQKQIKNLLDQNVVLQEEGRTIEIAAGFIEFIVVMYYSLNIWETLTPGMIFKSIPGFIKFGIMLTFAGNVVLVTRLAVDFFQKRLLKRKFIFSLVFLIFLVAVMILLSSKPFFLN